MLSWIFVSIILGDSLASDKYQAIISTNTDLLSIWPVRTNLSEIWIEIPNFFLNQMHSKCLPNDSHFVQVSVC